MTALLALVRTDLILFLSDRRALLLRMVMPILLGTFFGFLFGGKGATDNAKISVALVAQDNSDIGKKVAAGLKADQTFHIEELPLAEAQERVRKGKLTAAIVIPAGFGDAAGPAMFGAGAKPEIGIYYDPSQTSALAMVKGLLTQQVMQTVSAEMFGGKSGERFLNDGIEKLEKSAGADPQNAQTRDFLISLKKFQSRQGATSAGGGFSSPFSTKDEPMSSGPQYNGYAHSFAGMSVQFILFMGIDIGVAILLARRQGLWNRLLAAPIGLSTVLAARALSCALIAFGLLGAIFAFAAIVFKVHIASMAGFIAMGVCFALMTATFGLCIAAFGKTPEAARSLALFATLVMVMLSGAWVPSFLFPEWLQSATLVVPTRWAVDGLDGMTWRGLDFAAGMPAMGVQLGFAVLFGALAVWKFRNEKA
jgi:ABC-2 type transport system permease protein